MNNSYSPEPKEKLIQLVFQRKKPYQIGKNSKWEYIVFFHYIYLF